MKYIMTALLLAAATLPSAAIVRPASMFTDNMVLEQNAEVRIFGQADPASQITVTPSWNGKSYTTTTDMTGEWSLAVPTPAGSFTPYSITISDGEPLVLSSVLVGEVWLASGQSNMEMPLKGFPGCVLRGGYDQIASSRSQAGRIRFFCVPLTQSPTPLDTVAAEWTVPSPATSPQYSAVAWFFARRLADVLDVPVGIVQCAYGGSKVESWLPREILEQYSDVSLNPDDMENMTPYIRPLLMYNAMFNPVKDYTYKGIIWYQGCSNVGEDRNYADRLVTMVTHWRDAIGLGDIPFYSVEIAPFQYGSTQEEKAPLLRQAQHDAVNRLANAGIICINDLVEPYEKFNIHPANKEAVGFRLGDLALNRTYGQTQFPCVSPRYKGHQFKGNEAWVAIESPCDGICRNYDIRGFEVAGKDRVFHPADSAWLHWQTNEIVVSSHEVPEPVAVRYCWRDFLPGTLHAANYLPLLPFRTDNW